MTAMNRVVQLKNAGQLLEVEMDEAKILLPGGGLAAIGTRDLNACSGIAILGRAMILAHIAPLPPHDLGASQQREIEPGEGEAHFESLLLEVQTLYNTHISHFPNRTTTWAIFGTFEGEIAMPGKLEIARQRFHAMGLPMRSALYTIGKASERTNPAAGTVLGVLQSGITYLYVEDQLKDSINFNDQPTSNTVGGSAATTPAAGAWVYSSQRRQLLYQTAEGQPVPQSQWPQRAGTHRVFHLENRKWNNFNFDTNQWSQT
ncbi:hypothetical protein LTS12_027574, partial [Elasticomyces elasticus]